MKKLTSIIFVFFYLLKFGFAGEGMWIPMLLEQLNEPEMKSMGMRISAEDIYSINKSSLKDAILLFGRGCTAEIISDEGLILTNHHCGYGQIQKHSSLENDYLTTGFWAMERSQELPNPGLSVTLLVRMEDVTKQILEGVTAEMTEQARSEKIKANTGKVEKAASEGTGYAAKVKAFYYGNEYYLFITQTFNDVRLVGAPPSNIGKFGGDTDNWMWPRHTGDFSMFRIYVNKNNEPAEYSPDNVPYKPKSHLPISLKGVEKGDFTFVFGYPGSTQEYLPSFAIDMITGVENPPAIRLREKRLGIFDSYMKQSDLVRIQYSDKYAGVANYWKKMIGENRGIRKLDAIEKKQELERRFSAWAMADATRSERYGQLLPRFEKLYNQLKPISETETYLIEGGLGIEALRYAYGFRQLVAKSSDKNTPDDEIGKIVGQLTASSANFFRNYNQSVDRDVFASLMADWIEHQEQSKIPSAIVQGAIVYNNDYETWANKLYTESIFTDSTRVKKLLDRYSVRKFKKIEADPMFQLALSVYDHYFSQIQPESQMISSELDSLQRVYMQGLMEFQTDKRFYPDANSTLRVTYGKVDDYYPRDAVYYKYYTTLEGIMEKEDPAIYDYVVEPRLKQLYAEKDYGHYGAKDGTMRIAFIGSNHTTGGNSGSPVLNADGQLVGVNFDRNWEGTMSDLMYDPDQCRNISLDIRYCLFIIDKFAGAGHLVKEMTIVD
ncbi:MAG: S46 family peptidase [Bacteroidales bacterium]|nr:S46 family peptidase [Bacteroidales bacterium]